MLGRLPSTAYAPWVGGITLCRCNKRVDLHSDPLFFHCRSSQGKFIRRYDYIRDDIIGASVRDDPWSASSLLRCIRTVPDPLTSAPYYSPDEENDHDTMDIAVAVDAAEDTHCIEDIPRLYCVRKILADRRARGTENKAAGQCWWGDLGVSIDSLTTL